MVNYGNELNKMLKEEKNIVNRMYLNEIMLQYRKYKKALDENPAEEDYYQQIAGAMTDFSSQIDNHKYYFNKVTRTGFKKNSPVMSSLYIDDFLHSVMKRQKILKNKGVQWGKQSFTMNLQFDPHRFHDMEKDACLSYRDSGNFLQLTQQIDIQYRASGRRNLIKHTVVLPLIVFVIHKKLNAEEMIRLNYFAQKAKNSFNKAKMIIICETLDINFHQEEINSYVDFIFILRKRKSLKRGGVIHPDVLQELCENIEMFLYNCLTKTPDIEETGIVEI